MSELIPTQRLELRQWRESDRQPFAKLNADTQVMRYYPSVLNRPASDELFDKLRSSIAEDGWGLWAVERRDTEQFIGYVGLSVPSFELYASPRVEIGWRLAVEHWRRGFASEAARTVLSFGFEQLGLNEIVSFTAVSNLPSQRVMQAIGLQNQNRNFFHPKLPVEHPLAEHVLYSLSAEEWRALHSAC